MRPVRLRFSGLRSYRGEADIAFDDLDLFAVIGDTGAGKSTIIEALCLALYARKSWSGGAKLEELIADGEDLMRVNLTFVADGHEWEVTRARRRSGSSPVDKLASANGHVPTVDGARAVTDAVTELIGLNCDQFTRAVVMPQGRFDDLLRSTPAVRNEILKSILGLGDIAATAAAAVAARDRVRPIHDRYVERRRSLPANPVKNLTAAREGLSVATTRRDALFGALQALDEPIRACEVTEKSREKLADAIASLPDLPGDPVSTLQACRSALIALLEADSLAHSAEQAAKGEERAADEAISRTLAGFASRDGLAGATAKIAEAVSDLPNDICAVDNARTVRAALDDDPPAETVDSSLIEAAEQASTAAEKARAACVLSRDGVARARTAWMTLVDARAEHHNAVTSHRKTAAAVIATKAGLKGSQLSHVEASACLKAAETTLRAEQAANRIAAVAAGHRPGDDCPVCDRPLPEDFSVPGTPDIDAANEAVESARSRLDAANAEVHSKRTAAEKAAARDERSVTSVDEAFAKLTLAERDAAEAGVDVSATNVDDALVGSTAAAESDAATLELLAEEDKSAARALDTARAQLEAARSYHARRIEDADRAVSAALRRLKRHAETVVDLPEAWKAQASIGVDDLSEAMLEDLHERLIAAAADLDRITAAKTEAAAQLRNAETRRADIRAETLERVTQPAGTTVAAANGYLSRVRDVESATARAVADCGIETELPVRGLGDVTFTILAEELDEVIESIDGRLATAAATVAGGHAVLADVEQLAAKATTDIMTVLGSVGSASVDDLRADLGEARTQVLHVKGSVKDAEAAAAAAADVDKVLAVAGPCRENLDVLCAALGNNQFVDHLLELREAELLAEASRRLRTITGGRFGFVPDFGVVNIASGEIRSPDSLSGGERFQASLALALALVEIASRGGGRLDAVFVDEGFGSLDSNALDSALATLGKVAGGGKMVGLISHLHSVADYVDTVMHVTRDDLFGSRIQTLSESEREQLLADDVRSGLTV